jgi:hypothetical protein
METSMEAFIYPFESVAHQSVAMPGPVPPDRRSGLMSEFTHPRTVLDHPGMSLSRKRAVLAAWASDACAVEGRSAWRRIPQTGALVTVDDILDALQALDRTARN